jgi:hypothetical protein
MRLYSLPTFALLALLTSACRTEKRPANDVDAGNQPGQGIVAGTLDVQPNSSAKTLTLRNGTEFVVGYMVIEKDMMTVAMFPPCGADCEKIVQGQTVTVKYSEISGYTPDAREARVLWWTYPPGSTQPQGGVNTVAVRLD